METENLENHEGEIEERKKAIEERERKIKEIEEEILINQKELERSRKDLKELVDTNKSLFEMDDDFYIGKLADSLRLFFCLIKSYPLNVTFTDSDFDELENLIKLELDDILSDESKKELGTTIDKSTLKRILKYTYIVGEKIDLRKRRIIEKLVRFMGFENWTDYKEKVKIEFGRITNSIAYKPTPSEVAEIYKVIQESKKAEFALYVSLQDSQFLQLKDWYIHDFDCDLNCIYAEYKKRQSQHWFLVNTADKSNYVIESINLTFLCEDQVVIETQENWKLSWGNVAFSHTSYQETIDILKSNISLLVKKENTWKYNNQGLAEIMKGVGEIWFKKDKKKLQQIYQDIIIDENNVIDLESTLKEFSKEETDTDTL